MKKLFKILCLLLFLAFNQAVFAEDKTIAVISDVHLSSDKSGENKMTPSINNLLKAVDIVNQGNFEDVFFLGDNLNSANRYDLAMFAKIINRIEKPTYVTVGNRDLSKTKGLLKKEYYRILNKFSNNKLKTSPSYKKDGDFIFIFLSGVNENIPSYRGYYKLAELDFLDETLTKFKDKKAVIFQHFPIVEPKEDEVRKIVKPENYLNVIKKHNNVIAIISGHYHMENVAEVDGIKHISVGSLNSTGEFEQIKFMENKDGTYTITTKILNVE